MRLGMAKCKHFGTTPNELTGKGFRVDLLERLDVLALWFCDGAERRYPPLTKEGRVDFDASVQQLNPPCSPFVKGGDLLSKCADKLCVCRCGISFVDPYKNLDSGFCRNDALAWFSVCY